MDYADAGAQGRETEVLDRATEHARATLSALPPGARGPAFALFAAAPTERLFRWYDRRPARERAAYSETWRPVLAAVWAHAAGDQGAFRTIANALGAYYLSPYCSNGYDDGPEDMNEAEASAAFAAANCVMHGYVDFALIPAREAVDRLDFEWNGTDEDRRVAEIGAELDRQAADLARIAAFCTAHPHQPDGVPAELVAALRQT